MAIPPKKQIKITQEVKPSIFSFSFKLKCQILAIIGFIFYINSVSNRYALDDSIAIQRNAFVQMGISGIPKILVTDSYYSYYKNMGGDPTQQLKGGRYRPLSEIVFAIEQTLFGWLDNNPADANSQTAETTYRLAHVMHFINVIAYIICILSVFYFLDKFLLFKAPGGSDCAFLATVLFAIHPLHTEVVANIKSLDEILSVIFIVLTFIYSLRYLREKKNKQLLLGCGSLLLALLAKEYALTLVFFIPLLFYLLDKKKPMEAAIASLPYMGVVVVYILLRLNAVGFHSNIIGTTDILANPYLYATPLQKLATEWFVLGKYLKLLIIPYPLSADYSYNQIKYHTFSDITVLLSLSIYIAIFVCGIRLMMRKSILAFPVFFFLLNIFMVSNLLIDIGATMGERLVFHSSLGLVIILSWYSLKALSKIKFSTKKIIVLSTICLLSAICLGETVVRNTNWADDVSLFIHDVNVVPNSCLANNNAGFGYLSLCEDDYRSKNAAQAVEYLDSASKYTRRALTYDKNYEAAYLNLGAIYFHKENIDSAKYSWDMVGKLHPNHPSLKSKYALLIPFFLQRGLDLSNKGNTYAGLREIQKALSMSDTNAVIWYNLGGAYYTLKLYDSARYAWTRTLQIQPNYTDAKRGLEAISQMNQGK